MSSPTFKIFGTSFSLLVLLVFFNNCDADMGIVKGSSNDVRLNSLSSLKFSKSSDLTNPALLEAALVNPEMTYVFVEKKLDYPSVELLCCDVGSVLDSVNITPLVSESYWIYELDFSQFDGKQVQLTAIFYEEIAQEELPLRASYSFRVDTNPVDNNIIITSQPKSRTVFSGSSVILSTTAVSDATLSYQWQKDGIDVVGANSSIFAINSSAAINSGSYSCIISNSGNSVNTDNITLYVFDVFQPPSTKVTMMFSYNSNLSNAQPLQGAAVDPQIVYIFMADNNSYKSASYYCCKGVGGPGSGNPHNSSVSINGGGQLVFQKDLSSFARGGVKELYFDGRKIDDTGSDSTYSFFSISW